MVEKTFTVTGMSCAACSSAVERVTGKLEGVSRRSVNLTTNKLVIEYDENLLDEAKIMDTVKKAGFGIYEETDESLIEAENGNKPGERATSGKEKKDKPDRSRLRLIIAICFAAPLLYVSMGHMLPFDLPLPEVVGMESQPMRFALLQMILTIPVLIVGRHFYIRGIKALFRGHPNMDSLVAIGTMSAFLYSLYMTFSILKDTHAVHSLYYESAAVVLTLIMLGKYLEARSKGRTKEAIESLLKIVPETAHVVRDGVELDVAVAELKKDDIIRIKSGERVPIDGKILSGSSSIDESMLTGESIPVDKIAGDNVVGGSVNHEGMLEVVVTHTGKDTTIAKIVKLMEEAQGKKAPISKLADTIAGYFVPAVMSIAVIAGIIWYIATGDIEFVLKVFVSVLVIACPCALGLATPTAIMVGTGLGAKHGILIRSGEVLETMKKMQVVVLDKTGTVTYGKPEVVSIITNSMDENDVLKLAALAESGSRHPLAKAIVDEAKTRGVNAEASEYNFKFSSHTGMGVEASADLEGNGKESVILIGNEKMMRENAILTAEYESEVEKLAKKGATPVFVAIDGRIEAIIGIADKIKETSIEAIKELKNMGIEVVLLTGDNRHTAEHIAAQAGIERVIAEVLPEDKAQAVSALQSEGKRVIMVGDGMNDAPALVQADVGMAIGSGSDVAIESGDVVLMKSDLRDIPSAIRLSRYTIRNIKQNLFWAFFYNSLGIPVAAGILYPAFGILLSPVIGGFAMSLSSVCVVTNALRLRNKKI